MVETRMVRVKVDGARRLCAWIFFLYESGSASASHNAEHAEWFLTASTPTRVRTGMSYGGQGPRWLPGWYVSCSDSESAPQVRAVTLHGCFIRYSCCLKIKHNFMRGDLNRGAEHSICEWHVLPHGSTAAPAVLHSCSRSTDQISVSQRRRMLGWLWSRHDP